MLLISIVLSANAQTNTTATAPAAAPRPNIVHIVADDLGWKDVGFNGATDIKTPNLDKLAAGGAKLILLPQSLKEAGYNTAIIRKWHLGHADKKYWPKQRGFDYQYGAMIGELDYFTHEEHGVLDWYGNNKPVREKGYTTQLLGNDAVKYVNAQDSNKPFYLYLAFNAPHTPYQAPKGYIDHYPNIADPTRRTYAGMVTCLDDEVGRVVARAGQETIAR